MGAIRFGRIVAVLLTALAVTLLAGCSLLQSAVPGMGVDSKKLLPEFEAVWKAHSESAKWDMEVRDVIVQKKSTGEHMAPYTIFLTTYTNKAVPGFKLYETVDVPDNDSMTFEERANAFFDAIKFNSNFGGIQDVEGFMRFFAEKYPTECFVRVIQQQGSNGMSNEWKVVSLNSPPTKSTMAELPDSGITVTYDPKTKSWAGK